MGNLLLVAEIVGAITVIVTFVTMVIKPMRNHSRELKDVREGQKCLLRTEMLRLYYNHQDIKEIRQYEYENFMFSYKAYKCLGGNSFIDKIYHEIQEWTVVS